MQQAAENGEDFMQRNRFFQSKTNHKSIERWIVVVTSILVAFSGFVFFVAGLNANRMVPQGVPTEPRQDNAGASSEDTLVIGIDVPYEPFSYYSGTEIIGYDIDLINALAVELNTNVELTIVPWETIFDELISGNLDAVVSNVSITSRREEIMDFTLPYLDFSNEPVPSGIAVQQGDVELRRMFNEALWNLRDDGTLETIRAGVDGYYGSDIDVYLPDWPLVPTDTPTTLTYTDTNGSETALHIPVGALTETVMIAYTPTVTDTVPSGFSIIGQPFDLDAFREGIFVDGLFTFLAPVTITLSYSNTDVIGVDEDAITLDYWNDNVGVWEDAACGLYDRHPAENWLAVPICHLSRFAFVDEPFFNRLPIVTSE